MQVIRKLLPIEIPALKDHLLRLSPKDRSSRFHGGVSDQSIADYAGHPDRYGAILLGCFDRDVLRGVAEIARTEGGWFAEGELAVTVEGPWQGRGVGTDLVRRALVSARNRAIRTIHAICVTDNVSMQRIVRKFEGELVVLHGVSEGEIRLFGPDLLSVLEEALGEVSGWTAAAGGQLGRSAQAHAPCRPT